MNTRSKIAIAAFAAMLATTADTNVAVACTPSDTDKVGCAYLNGGLPYPPQESGTRALEADQGIAAPALGQDRQRAANRYLVEAAKHLHMAEWLSDSDLASALTHRRAARSSLLQVLKQLPDTDAAMRIASGEAIGALSLVDNQNDLLAASQIMWERCYTGESVGWAYDCLLAQAAADAEMTDTDDGFFLLEMAKARAAAADFEHAFDVLSEFSPPRSEAQWNPLQSMNRCKALVAVGAELVANGYTTKGHELFAEAAAEAGHGGRGCGGDVRYRIAIALAEAGGEVAAALERMAAVESEAGDDEGTGRYLRWRIDLAEVLTPVDPNAAASILSELNPASMQSKSRETAVRMLSRIATTMYTRSGDENAAAALLDRALELAGGEGSRTVRSLVDIAYAWHEVGRSDEAKMVLDHANQAKLEGRADLAELAAARTVIEGREIGAETLDQAYAAMRRASSWIFDVPARHGGVWKVAARAAGKGLELDPGGVVKSTLDSIRTERHGSLSEIQSDVSTRVHRVHKAIRAAYNTEHAQVTVPCSSSFSFSAMSIGFSAKKERMALAFAHYVRDEWSQALDILECEHPWLPAATIADLEWIEAAMADARAAWQDAGYVHCLGVDFTIPGVTFTRFDSGAFWGHSGGSGCYCLRESLIVDTTIPIAGKAMENGGQLCLDPAMYDAAYRLIGLFGSQREVRDDLHAEFARRLGERGEFDKAILVARRILDMVDQTRILTDLGEHIAREGARRQAREALGQAAEAARAVPAPACHRVLFAMIPETWCEENERAVLRARIATVLARHDL